MTKEQFITFKEDLKKAVEIVKLENKWHKAWWNCGFNNEEEYKEQSACNRVTRITLKKIG